MTFVPRTITIIDFVALIMAVTALCLKRMCPSHASSISFELHCESNDNGRYSGETENTLKTFYCHKHNIMMILNLKRSMSWYAISILIIWCERLINIRGPATARPPVNYTLCSNAFRINEAICLRHCACSCSPSVRDHKVALSAYHHGQTIPGWLRAIAGRFTGNPGFSNALF